MQVSVEKLEGLSRKVQVTVPADMVESKYQQRLNKVAKTAKIDGFRQGKVPAKVIEKRFGAGIRQEIVGELLDETFRKAVEENELTVIGQPNVEPLKEIIAGQPFEYTVTFETLPEVELKLLDGNAIEFMASDVEDADVTEMIEKLRKQQAEWILADRPAENGDKLDIDFEGFMEGKAFDGGKATNFSLELGSNSMIPGFEDGLLACQAGDETTLNVSFPEEYHVKELAGKPAEFKVKVNSVMMSELISDDDKLAEKMQIEGGADKLKEEAKTNMQRELKRALDADRKNKVFEKLIEANDIVVPQALVDEEITNLQKMSLQQMGGEEAVKQFDKLNLPKEPYQKDAEKRVKLGLLLAEVVKHFDIKPDADKVDAHIDDIAAMYPEPEQVKQWYKGNRQMLAEIEAAVVEDLAVEHLTKNMDISEKATKYFDVVNPQQPQE